VERRSGQAHTLLSGGNLSGGQREEVLGRVLAGVEAPARWRRALAWAGGSMALAATAAFLLFVRPAGEPRPKGAAAPIVRVDCEPGGLAACRQGGTLMFAVEGARPDARVAAWAEPTAGGERVWYFSGDGESPAVGDRTTDAILRRGIRVGPEHQPGAYRLTVLITETALPRAALLELAQQGGALATRTWSLTVVP
jgi:hypothetical protein